MRCFTVPVTVDLKPRPRWITCCLVQNAARCGFQASGVQSLSLLRTVLVVSEYWSTTGGFCGGDHDGAASVRCLLPSTVSRDSAANAAASSAMALDTHLVAFIVCSLTWQQVDSEWLCLVSGQRAVTLHCQWTVGWHVLLMAEKA